MVAVHRKYRANSRTKQPPHTLSDEPYQMSIADKIDENYKKIAEVSPSRRPPLMWKLQCVAPCSEL